MVRTWCGMIPCFNTIILTYCMLVVVECMSRLLFSFGFEALCFFVMARFDIPNWFGLPNRLSVSAQDTNSVDRILSVCRKCSLVQPKAMVLQTNPFRYARLAPRFSRPIPFRFAESDPRMEHKPLVQSTNPFQSVDPDLSLFQGFFGWSLINMINVNVTVDTPFWHSFHSSVVRCIRSFLEALCSIQDLSL